jgi:hypothetical protein
MRKLN